MANAIIYARVSTTDQNTDRQILELETAITERGDVLTGTYIETLSGATLNENRPELQKMLAHCKSLNVARIYVHEVSRLGRDTAEVLQTLKELHSLGISVYVLNYSIETLNADKTPNPMAQFLFTMLAEFARLERETLTQRIKSGMQQAKANGKLIHRPKGSVKPTENLLKDHKDIVKGIKKGLSIREIAKLTGKSKTTVQKVKTAMKKTCGLPIPKGK